MNALRKRDPAGHKMDPIVGNTRSTLPGRRPPMSWRTLLIGLAAAACYARAVLAAETPSPRPASVVLEVFALKHDRYNTPVECPLPEPFRNVSALALTDLGSRKTVDAQVLPGRPPQLAWIVRDCLKAGMSRRFRLAPAAVPPRPGTAATCRDDGRQLLLAVGAHPVLQYQQALVESPPGLPSIYRRSGQIHPLFDPAGRILSDDFPPDHAHQHGMFFAWVHSNFEGRDLDFWNQNKGTARIDHQRVVSIAGGPVCAEFVVALRWTDLVAPHGPMPVLDETWRVRVYNIAEHFLIDLESRQTCAGDSPLTLPKYHYGGMAFRGNRQWYDAAIEKQVSKLIGHAGPAELAKVARKYDYLTSDGKTWLDGNATRARWVEIHGLIDGRPSGAVVLGHPRNFRAPQPVRLHPGKPYFCFAPMILGDFAIEPGKPYVSRYRYYVHTGEPDRAVNERIWNDYADPPQVVAR